MVSGVMLDTKEGTVCFSDAAFTMRNCKRLPGLGSFY
jgi:hypothetical protein